MNHSRENPLAPDDEGVLLSVNNRLARELQREHASRQIAAGRKIWHTPRILAWSTWLLQQHSALLESGYALSALLNTHQERLFWEQAVSESHEGGKLLRPAAAARSARQAWQILHDWRIAPETLLQHPDPETRLFADWARRFAQLCEQARSISVAEIGALYVGALREQLIPAPTAIRLAGFDNLTPMQTLILDSLGEAGCDLGTLEQNDRIAQPRRIALPQRQDEYLAAAEWARQALEDQPAARLAIVSVRLEQERDALERTLAQVLNPSDFLSSGASAAPFNISLGKPLSDYPLVGDLLLALRLALDAPLQLNDIGLLLRSAFIGGHAREWLQRAELDRFLRDRGQALLRRGELLYHADRLEQGHPAHCPELVSRLRQLNDWLGTIPQVDSPNAWSGHLLRLMDLLGWPGDHPLNSSEYQQAERLRRLVSEFSTLSRVRSAFHLSQAITQFRALCEETEFQPRHEQARLQVLGMLEAAGLAFDGVWILGLDDQSWPPAPSPNPLLPASLQREKDMPHASAERELTFAQRVLQRLLQSAGEVVVSHAQQEDERELRASPLIQEVTPVTPGDLGLTLANPLHRASSRSRALEALPVPEQVPALGTPGGGASLLSDQAACPFRAMARHRLGARALPEAQPAPDPRLLGKLVHQLLERVWTHLQDSATLKASSQSELEQLVANAADQSLAELGRERPDLYRGAFRELEQVRLSELALAWLAYETRRQQDFRVVACEQRAEIRLNDLPLRLRVDRIDQLDDGSLVIIDYKTGQRVSASGWTEQRPSEPQVPLYCISHPGVSAGILAQVNRGKLRMHGIARDPGVAPGLADGEQDGTPAWDELLEQWRQRLEALAREIQEGFARVQPSGPDSCSHCDLPGLCRVASAPSDEPGDA